MYKAANREALRRSGGTIVQEFRKANRYQLSAPVLFSWQRSDGKFQVSEGVTRDISMRGIFVLAAEAPAVGAYIEVDAHLPALSGRGRTVKLHGGGRVLRVEEQLRSVWGFAAEVFFQSEPESVDTVLGSAKIQ